MDPQLTHEFLQIVANVNDVCEQLRAVTGIVDVGAVVRLSATACKDVPWQWWYNDDARSSVSDKKCRGVFKDFSKDWHGTYSDVPCQVVFSGRAERH
jgi:hypothetical protein